VTAPRRPYTTIQSPPAGGLAVAYFEPLMAPTPVGTRLPQPSETADTINGFLRVQAGGGAIMGNEVMFNVGVILNSYAPNNEESFAEQLLVQAIAWGNNAMGTTIVHPSTGISYFVAYSRTTALGTKQQDPLVNLTRFRGMVTWRMLGVPVSLPVSGRVSRTADSRTSEPLSSSPESVRTPTGKPAGARRPAASRRR